MVGVLIGRPFNSHATDAVIILLHETSDLTRQLEALRIVREGDKDDYKRLSAKLTAARSVLDEIRDHPHRFTPSECCNKPYDREAER
jgi:hypothetical protein